MNREEIIEKINLVINKLMNLDMPENEKELEKGGESTSFFKRDFGMKEWDCPN